MWIRALYGWDKIRDISFNVTLRTQLLKTVSAQRLERGNANPGGLAYERGGMLVVSVGGVNSGFRSHLGCSDENDIMCTSRCSREGLAYGSTRKNVKIYLY